MKGLKASNIWCFMQAINCSISNFILFFPLSSQIIKNSLTYKVFPNLSTCKYDKQKKNSQEANVLVFSLNHNLYNWKKKN